MRERLVLSYLSVTGERLTATGAVGADFPAAPPLRARQVFLEDGTELRQVLPGDDDRPLGFARLDNEILAGLRLSWLMDGRRAACPPGASRPAGVPGGHRTALIQEAFGQPGPSRPDDGYPAQVSRLHGYEPDSAEPFALLYPYRGETAADVCRALLPDEQERFWISLLQGLRWLAVAGLAHRVISPATVRWDKESRQVQITDFSQATVCGVPRTVVGTSLWAAPEQRPRGVGGQVTGTDDVWAVGHMAYYLLTGEELKEGRGSDQLEGVPDPAGLMAAALQLADQRPDALQLLKRCYNEPDPVPRHLIVDPLREGRLRFAEIRAPGGGEGGPGQDGPGRPVADGPGGSRRPARRRSRRLGLGGLLLAVAVVVVLMVLR